MGTRGPAPKRLAERLGHVTKAEKAGVLTVKLTAEVVAPPLPRGMHPIARRWYQSLALSGQSLFYEPSDWAEAILTAEMITRALDAPRLNAAMFSAINSRAADLLTTEASRRRLRLEIQRERSAGPTEDAPTAMEQYRKALGAS